MINHFLIKFWRFLSCLLFVSYYKFVAYLIRIKALLPFEQKRNQKSFEKYGIWKPIHELCWCLKYFKRMKSSWSLCLLSYFWVESLNIQNTETHVGCPLEYNTITFLHDHVTLWECWGGGGGGIDIGFSWALLLIKVTIHLQNFSSPQKYMFCYYKIKKRISTKL